MRVLRLQKPDQHYVVVELLHRAPRTERTAGHSASRGAQPGGHSAGRAYKPARRLSNGNAEMDFPGVQLKHDQPASTPDGRSPNPRLGPSFRRSSSGCRGGPSRRLARMSPRASLPAGKGVLTFTPNRWYCGQGRLWSPRRVLRLDDMPGTGPPRGGAEGVIAMRRAGVIAALSALLGLLGGVVTASPALAGGRGPK